MRGGLILSGIVSVIILLSIGLATKNGIVEMMAGNQYSLTINGKKESFDLSQATEKERLKQFLAEHQSELGDKKDFLFNSLWV